MTEITALAEPDFAASSYPPSHGDEDRFLSEPIESVPKSDRTLPGSIPGLLARVEALGDLDLGWDSYGAKPIRLEAREAAKKLLNDLTESTTPTPNVVPMPTGGVALEWHVRDKDISVEVEGEDRIEFLWSNESTGEEFEGKLPADGDKFQGFLRALQDLKPLR